ncbi:MAG: DUF2459 domain-containing protein [Phycisphaerales bacterium]|nr:DUF2459 domain-containing protein [Hyphomonadaceae bacterium]
MRRPLLLGFAAAAAALLTYLYVPLPAPDVAPASAGDCVELHLYSNGYHSDIAAPASIFPADHALRRLYPEAESFLIGWGDQRFYYSDGTDVLLGLDALIPPSPSVLHVAYNAASSSVYLGPNDDTAIAVSREGAARFVAYVDRALVLDEAGALERTSDGKVVGRSSFLRTRGSFHLFNVCNQWMARALRAAGVNVNARAAWLAGPLIRQVREDGQTSCTTLNSASRTQPRP